VNTRRALAATDLDQAGGLSPDHLIKINAGDG